MLPLSSHSCNLFYRNHFILLLIIMNRISVFVNIRMSFIAPADPSVAIERHVLISKNHSIPYFLRCSPAAAAEERHVFCRINSLIFPHCLQDFFTSHRLVRIPVIVHGTGISDSRLRKNRTVNPSCQVMVAISLSLIHI